MKTIKRTTVVESVRLGRDELIEAVRKAGPNPRGDITIQVLDSKGDAFQTIDADHGLTIYMEWTTNG